MWRRKAGYIRKIRKYYSGGVGYYRKQLARKHLTVQVLNTEPIWLIGILTSLSTGIVSRISDLVRRSSLISPGPPPVYQCTSARMDELCHWSHNCAMTCGTQLPWDHSHLLPPTPRPGTRPPDSLTTEDNHRQNEFNELAYDLFHTVEQSIQCLSFL